MSPCLVLSHLTETARHYVGNPTPSVTGFGQPKAPLRNRDLVVEVRSLLTRWSEAPSGRHPPHYRCPQQSLSIIDITLVTSMTEWLDGFASTGLPALGRALGTFDLAPAPS